MSKPVIKLGNVTVPADLKGKELIRWMVENKATLIAEKKSAQKNSDAFSIHTDIQSKYFIDKEGKLIKAPADIQTDMNKAETVLCVINTTNWLDSHDDVHIPGLWDKSIKEKKIFTHLQEHEMSFTHIISDNAKGYTEKIKWKDLGMEAPGVTEALIFASPLIGRNAYMEDQYRKGYVKNHSVGMRYVVIKFCVNEPDEEYYKEEYANWVLYAPMIVNKDKAEEQGYFWAVIEAKIIEGSAVPIGSNIITPTIGFKSVQPEISTEQNQPPQGTEVKEEKPEGVNWDKIANKILTH